MDGMSNFKMLMMADLEDDIDGVIKLLTKISRMDLFDKSGWNDAGMG